MESAPATFLETPRLRLRDCVEAGLGRLLALDNDPGVKRFIDGGVPAVPETFREEALPRLLGLRFVRTYFEDWPEAIEGSEEGDVEYALTREEWRRTAPATTS